IAIALTSGVFVAVAASSRHGSGMSGLVGVALAAGAFAVWMVVSMVIGTLVLFTYPLIVDKRVRGLDALKLSLRAASANVWGLVGLSVITTAMGIAGVLCCYVGAFLVMPVSFGAFTAAYVRVFGLSEAVLPASVPG